MTVRGPGALRLAATLAAGLVAGLLSLGALVLRWQGSIASAAALVGLTTFVAAAIARGQSPLRAPSSLALGAAAALGVSSLAWLTPEVKSTRDVPARGLVWPRLSEENLWDERVTPGRRPILERADLRWVGATHWPARLSGTSIRDRLDVHRALVQARAVKSDRDLRPLRTAARAVELALLDELPRFHRGATERELADALRLALRRRGCERESFPVTVRSAGWTPALRAGTRNIGVLHTGDVAYVELGCRVDGWASEVARMIPVDGRFTPLQRRAYAQVVSAQKAAIAACHAGAPMFGPESIASHARAELHDLEPRFDAHGLGLELHEPVPSPLALGAVITLEPGLVPARMRLQDAFVVTARGCEPLADALPTDPDQLEELLGLRTVLTRGRAPRVH